MVCGDGESAPSRLYVNRYHFYHSWVQMSSQNWVYKWSSMFKLLSVFSDKLALFSCLIPNMEFNVWTQVSLIPSQRLRRRPHILEHPAPSPSVKMRMSQNSGVLKIPLPMNWRGRGHPFSLSTHIPGVVWCTDYSNIFDATWEVFTDDVMTRRWTFFGPSLPLHDVHSHLAKAPI